MVLAASSSSDDTTTWSPQEAPSVMISRAESASTGSPSGRASVTSASSSPAASEMIDAGLACSPTAEPTVTVILAMNGPSIGGGGGVSLAGGSRVDEAALDCLRG